MMGTVRILQAARFAAAAHANRSITPEKAFRKYTGEPYIVHPLEVAETVAAVMPDDENAVIASLLHDTVEDTDVTLEEIRALFGEDVANLVFELTDPKLEANRAARKARAREFLSMVSPRAKTIKLADLKNNTKTIVTHDPNFAKVYMREKRELLPSLKGGHSELHRQCSEMVESYFHLAGEEK